MAQPFDWSATLLTSLSDAIRQIYMPGFPEQTWRFGRTFNRIFQPSARKINGDGINIQVMDRLQYGAQFSRSINGAFPQPESFSADYYKVTLSETDASNDFSSIKVSGRVTYLDLVRAKDDTAAAVQVAEKIYTQMRDDFQESLAIHRQIPQTAQVGTVSTDTPKQNDASLYADCSATPAASTGVRFKLTNSAIAYFQPGRKLSVYSSAGVYRGDIIVTDYNPVDLSVGAYLLDANGNQDTATSPLNKVQASDKLYFRGEYNKGMKSVGEWFTDPSSGDSFFGKDRTNPLNRYLIPTKVKISTARPFTKTDLDTLAVALGYVREAESAGVLVMQPNLEQAFRNEVGEDIVYNYPKEGPGGEMLAKYGFLGSVYVHPQLGVCRVMADPLAAYNTVRYLKLDSWETLYAIENGLTFVPAGDGFGFWYRMSSGTPGDAKSLSYQCDALSLLCDITDTPRLQGQISNVQGV